MVVIIKFHDIYFFKLSEQNNMQLLRNKTVAIDMIFVFTKSSVNMSAQ